MLERFTSLFTGSKIAAPAELEAALSVLKAVDGKLYDQAVGYVMTGADASFLTAWASGSDDRPWRYLDQPGTIGWFWSQSRGADDEVIGKAVRGWSIEKSTTARGTLWERVNKLDDEQLIRLGRLLAAFSGTRVVQQNSPRTPVWLALLVLDTFSARAVRDEARVRRFAKWSPALLERLLRGEGHSAEDATQIVLATIFDRVGLRPDYSGTPLRTLLGMPGLAGYVTANSAQLAGMVTGFAAEGRRAFLDFIGDNGMLDLFLDTIIELAVDPSKLVRTDAFALINNYDVGVQAQRLGAIMLSTPAGRLAELVHVLSRTEPGRAVLTAALEAEPTGKRADVIRNAIERESVLGSESATEEADGPAAPALPPLVLAEDVPLGDDFIALARAAVTARVATSLAAVESARAAPQDRWSETHLKNMKKWHSSFESISDRDIAAAAAYYSGTGRAPGNLHVIEQATGTANIPMPLFAALRKGHTEKRIYWYRVMSDGVELPELRVVEDALARIGVANPWHEVMSLVFQQHRYDLQDSADKIWPFFAEHPETLEYAMGLRPFPAGIGVNKNGYTESWEFGRVLEILALLPSLPKSVLSRLGELSLGQGKSFRLEAQQLLATHVDARALATQGLSNSKFEIRSTAASWLARIGDPEAVPALQAALAKEKREPAKAAILSALERLGVDISEFLSPTLLVAEAKKGATTARPASIAWFPFDAIPDVSWATGTRVDRFVLEWWVTLAAKLNDPAGAGLLGRYVEQLDQPSQAALGEFVVRAWVAEDTKHPPDAESRAFAEAGGPARYTYMQDLAKRHPEYYGEYATRTLDDMIEEMRREHASQYVGSAISSKGVLALGFGTPGHRLVAIIQSFMRDHYVRRAQVEALITAASFNDDPMAMQLILGVARRHRTASVQTKARELVEALAERKGWTTDELADRTVPTAGFDDDGILRLSYGEREFTGRLTAKFTLELTGPTGTVLKSLPAKRELEDDTLVKEAKAQLTASRGELKQLVAMQTQRLYEAMCTSRDWPAADWQEFLLGHPIVSRLIAGLVWVENRGPSQRLFRVADGALIDAHDDDIELAPGATVALAHTALITEAEANQWRAHLVDYGVTAIFDQFGGATPQLAADATEITDHRGWVSDAFTIRGLATKHNYLRGSSEDGGWFVEYTKDFTSAAVRVVLGFTGNSLPEENIRAAVTTLSARSLVRGRAGGRDIPLSSLPPVLLAEAYGDYVAIAQAGAFETDWEKNTGW